MKTRKQTHNQAPKCNMLYAFMTGFEKPWLKPEILRKQHIMSQSIKTGLVIFTCPNTNNLKVQGTTIAAKEINLV